ncbi:helix-turn-helix domain-containing protein [Salinisphaera sp. T31B1]|uniref:helix-turn-helix domain-containing protein n=1 Tax=Salinisphaera sp. T31B1 TaxID=727963 RepID=UPI0033420472
MTDSSDEYEEDVAPTNLTRNKADGQSPGEILREARLANEYSVEDLCAQTKLSAKTVHALEDNDFAALSQPVFARGYYRQCAKVLDIDSERLMAAYSAWGGAPVAAHAASPAAVDVVPQDVTPGGWRSVGLIGGVVLLLVAVGAVYLLLPDAGLSDNDTPGTDNDTMVLSDNDAPGASQAPADDNALDRSTTTPDIAGDAAGETAGAAGVAGSSENSASGQSTAGGRRTGGRNVNDTLGLNRDDAEAEAAPADEPTEPAVDPAHLTLEFTGRSWVDVRDADGSRLLTGIFESGETREFDGTPPYKITLGYAPGVNVTIGGQPVDVAAQTTGNATARLTVAAAGDN